MLLVHVVFFNTVPPPPPCPNDNGYSILICMLDIENRGVSPFLAACFGGHGDVVHSLLSHGLPDLESVVTQTGNCPLSFTYFYVFNYCFLLRSVLHRPTKLT